LLAGILVYLRVRIGPVLLGMSTVLMLPEVFAVLLFMGPVYVFAGFWAGGPGEMVVHAVQFIVHSVPVVVYLAGPLVAGLDFTFNFWGDGNGEPVGEWEATGSK